MYNGSFVFSICLYTIRLTVKKSFTQHIINLYILIPAHPSENGLPKCIYLILPKKNCVEKKFGKKNWAWYNKKNLGKKIGLGITTTKIWEENWAWYNKNFKIF